MNLQPHEIIVRPIVSEESQIQVVKANQYTFQVNPRANKRQIAAKPSSTSSRKTRSRSCASTR
jgi:hypothetical protein